MATNNREQVTYKRTKDGMEISGHKDAVNRHIWYDQVSNSFRKLIPGLIAACVNPVLGAFHKIWTTCKALFRDD